MSKGVGAGGRFDNFLDSVVKLHQDTRIIFILVVAFQPV